MERHAGRRSEARLLCGTWLAVRESPVHWAEWVALAELAAVSLFAMHGIRRGDRFGAALGALLILASAVALWSTTRIAEKIFDHDVFWIAGIGVLNLAVSLELIASSLLPRLRTRDLTMARAAAVVLLGAAAAAGAWRLQDIVEAVHRSARGSAGRSRCRGRLARLYGPRAGGASARQDRSGRVGCCGGCDPRPAETRAIRLSRGRLGGDVHAGLRPNRGRGRRCHHCSARRTCAPDRPWRAPHRRMSRSTSTPNRRRTDAERPSGALPGCPPARQRILVDAP